MGIVGLVRMVLEQDQMTSIYEWSILRTSIKPFGKALEPSSRTSLRFPNTTAWLKAILA